MTTGDAERRAEKLESHPEGSRRNRREESLGASKVTAMREATGPETEQLMEAVVERENMWLALKQVERNRGAAGVDKMTVEQLRAYMRELWLRNKEELLADNYRPQPVLKVEIPKPGGKGMRTLGIPTVIDRLIQQALHQVLSPIFEPDFSESSYGFRPNRSAQQAVVKAREYVREGRRWVVDIDLEKFFDRVNHDILMSRLTRRIKDKRVLRLIRRYLQAGMMSNGLATARREGTPQGGPLSPLLSNILLDELDKELERRGHKFCRYADDCNVYVRSRSAGERVKDQCDAHHVEPRARELPSRQVRPGQVHRGVREPIETTPDRVREAERAGARDPAHQERLDCGHQVRQDPAAQSRPLAGAQEATRAGGESARGARCPDRGATLRERAAPKAGRSRAREAQAGPAGVEEAGARPRGTGGGPDGEGGPSRVGLCARRRCPERGAETPVRRGAPGNGT